MVRLPEALNLFDKLAAKLGRALHVALRLRDRVRDEQERRFSREGEGGDELSVVEGGEGRTLNGDAGLNEEKHKEREQKWCAQREREEERSREMQPRRELEWQP